MHTPVEILSVVGHIALESPEVAGGPCTPEPHVLSVSPDAPSQMITGNKIITQNISYAPFRYISLQAGTYGIENSNPNRAIAIQNIPSL